MTHKYADQTLHHKGVALTLTRRSKRSSYFPTLEHLLHLLKGNKHIKNISTLEIRADIRLPVNKKPSSYIDIHLAQKPNPYLANMTTPTPIITTPKFHLRHYIKADAEPMVLVLNDRSIAKNMRSRLPSPYALSDAMYWITLCENDTSEPRLKSFGIFMPDGELAGSIGLEDPKGDPIYAGTRELGYLMSSKFRGQGSMFPPSINSFVLWVCFV